MTHCGEYVKCDNQTVEYVGELITDEYQGVDDRMVLSKLRVNIKQHHHSASTVTLEGTSGYFRDCYFFSQPR